MERLPIVSSPRAALASLFLTVFIDLLGFGLTIPLLPYYARAHGATALEVSLLSTAFSAMQFAFMPLWGALSDREGRRPVLLWSIAATALSMALLAVARSYVALVLVRLFQGITTANVAVAQAYITDVSPAGTRARAMGLIGMAFGLGFILGPFVGGILAHVSPTLPGLLAAAFSAINFLLAWRRLPESLPPRDATTAVPPSIFRVVADTLSLRALRRVMALPGVAVLATLFFFHVLAFTHLESTFALFLCDRFGLSARETGYTFAFVGLVVAGVQGGAIGPLVRRFGERTLLRVGLASLAIGMLAFAVLRAPAWVDVSRCDVVVLPEAFVARMGPAWIVLAMVSFGNALVMPTVSALASKVAPVGQAGVVLGGQQSASSLARVLGPALAGMLYQRLGPPAPYVAASLGMFVAWMVSLRVERPSVG